MSHSSNAVSFASPLRILVRVHLLQIWRRIKSIRQQSHLLSAFIGLFLIGYLAFAFWLFHKGLRFVASFPGLGSLLIERLLFILFAFLFVLLLFSNLVISYTNFFRNRESSFLFTMPIARETVFQWKFIESGLLASWAFLFLIAPLLAAYGMTRGVAWHFYPLTVVMIALFIVLPAVAGSWLAVQLARFMDRRLFQIAALLVVVGGAAGAVIWLRPEPVTDEMLETRVLVVLDRLLMKTRFAQFPFLPSYWLSSGVLQWSEGALGTASLFALVLLSYALFFGLLSFTRMGNLVYDAASTVQSRSSVLGRWAWFREWHQRKTEFRFEAGWLEKALRGLFWMGADTRALLAKDIRIFWRDTSQWGQTLVLFGLLGVYIINLRHFSQQLTNPFWIQLVSFLNLSACSLNLATLTTRFVYPQFSLEGKRIWIVGMAPFGLRRLVIAKYMLASTASLLVTLGLVSLSCQMLRLSWDRTLYFGFAISMMTLTLNGLAVGLGVLYPNLKEDNPSKIVSGFGGTFCLVLSFLYIVAAVSLLAVGSPRIRGGGQSLAIVAASWACFLTFSISLGWIPVKLALRKVETAESQ